MPIRDADIERPCRACNTLTERTTRRCNHALCAQCETQLKSCPTCQTPFKGWTPAQCARFRDNLTTVNMLVGAAGIGFWFATMLVK